MPIKPALWSILAFICVLSPVWADYTPADRARYQNIWANTATLDQQTTELRWQSYLALGQMALSLEHRHNAVRAAQKLGALLRLRTPAPAELRTLTEWLDAFADQYGSRTMLDPLLAGLTDRPAGPAAEILLRLSRDVRYAGSRWVAVALATAALTFEDDAPIPATQARLLLVEMYRQLNRPDDARRILQALKTPAPVFASRALVLQAELALDAGDPAAARPWLVRALATLPGDHAPSAARYARARARLELVIGDITSARAYAHRAVTQARRTDSQWLIVNTLILQIRILALTDTEAASEQFDALQTFGGDLPGDAWIEGLALLIDPFERILAPTNWRADPEAVKIVTEAYAIYDAGLERTLRSADAALGTEWLNRPAHLARHGVVRSMRGRIEEANALFAEALAVVDASAHPHRAFVHQRVADHHARRGRPILAIWHGKQAIDHLQTLRKRIEQLAEVGESPDGFIELHRPAYVVLADRLIQQGRIPEAQQVLDLLKHAEVRDYTRAQSVGGQPARSAREQRAERRIRIVRGPLTQLAHRAQRLRRRAESALAGGAPLSEAERTEHAAATEQLAAARTHYRAAMEYVEDQLLLAGRRAAVTDRALPQLHTLQALVAQLGPKVALLHVVVTPQRINLILTTARTQTAHAVAVPVGTLNQEVHALQRALRNPNADPSRPAKALYRRLIGPIRGELNAGGVRTLMVSLDAALRYIPMAALLDPGSDRYLAQDFTLTRYGATARKTLSQPYVAPELSVTALGTTKAHGTLNALPGVATELERIVRHGPKDDGVARGTIALDGAFTRGALRTALREGLPKVHVATHFVFKPGTDADSYLLLGDGSHLSMAALRTEDFDFGDVDLLTVSACETAVGLGEDGRELDGFGALIQAQGARAVLATLWPVADEGTAEFMEHFYRALAAGQGRAAALHTAQLAFIEGRSGPTDGATVRGLRRPVEPSAPDAPTPAKALDPHQHPYYWAPFILMGDWR